MVLKYVFKSCHGFNFLIVYCMWLINTNWHNIHDTLSGPACFLGNVIFVLSITLVVVEADILASHMFDCIFFSLFVTPLDVFC